SAPLPALGCRNSVAATINTIAVLCQEVVITVRNSLPVLVPFLQKSGWLIRDYSSASTSHDRENLVWRNRFWFWQGWPCSIHPKGLGSPSSYNWTAMGLAERPSGYRASTAAANGR